MRRHAAERGAVTSRFGCRNPDTDWRAGRSVGFREEAAVAGKARLHGPDGRADVTLRLDQGRGKRPRPVRKNGPVTIQNTAVERRSACALRHWARTPRQACRLSVTPISDPLPLPLGRRGKETE